MDELDQAMNIAVGDDSKGNAPVAKSVDDPLDSALLDMVPTIPDF